MKCLPESGRCERRLLEPFVVFLNRLEGASYQHTACLDIEKRNSPQPEALYEDQNGGLPLVIERKSFVWPRDYAKRHKADHDLADGVMEAVGSALTDAPYLLTVNSGSILSRQHIRVFAAQLSEWVTQYRDVLTEGSTWIELCGVRFQIRKQDPCERDDDDPKTGLGLSFETQGDLQHAHERLGLEADRLLEAAALKCAEYSGMRSVLLIDPIGDAQYFPDSWWAEVFSPRSSKGKVSEVWITLREMEGPTDVHFCRAFPGMAVDDVQKGVGDCR